MDQHSAALSERTALDRMNAFCVSLPEYPGGFFGRGIVIPAGGARYFACAWVCIHMLRRFGCRLPIQLWHLGPEEITDEMRSLVAPHGVECVDAREVAGRHPARILNGWELKCYAILHSRFEEVLLLDADNVPVVDPTFLFESEPYAKLGAIFWPDYGRLDAARSIWRLTGVQYRDEPEFESGQIVVSKSRCWGPLQLTRWMNDHSDFWYAHIHGDKETFHLAWRKLDREYAMPSLGIKGLDGVMCQHDFTGRRIFQHRNMRKWTISGENPRTRGFLFEAECLAYLDLLAQAWKDRSFPRFLERSATPAMRVMARSLCERSWVYRRIGHDERAMTFRLDGRVDHGAEGCERTWALEESGATLLLTICGDDGVTCRLEALGPDRWRGKWLVHERMPIELTAYVEEPVRPIQFGSAKKRLIYSTNAAYFDMLRISIASFLRHNNNGDWAIAVLDVGLSPWQRRSLQRIGVDAPVYPAHHPETAPGLTYPATWSRLKMLEDFTADGALLLYLDADSLVLSSVEPMVTEFVASGQAIGLATEITDMEWAPPKMSKAFKAGALPEFPRYEQWKDHLVMNTGVILARGTVAGEIGRQCTALYPSVSEGAVWAEQSILNAVLLDRGYTWWEIPQHYHCMVRADLLQHEAPIYEGGATYRGRKVVVRHFCGGSQKDVYIRDVLPKAREFFDV